MNDWAIWVTFVLTFFVGMACGAFLFSPVPVHEQACGNLIINVEARK